MISRAHDQSAETHTMHLAGLRNSLAFVIALGSSYSLSFILDMVVHAATVDIRPPTNIVAPVITWSVISSICFAIAQAVAVSRRALCFAYLVNGIVATLASLSNPLNLFVGIPLLVIAYFLH